MMIYATDSQKGVIGVLVLISFISISLSLLASFSYYYRQAQHLVMMEIQAKQAFLLAESALSWGITLHWDINSVNLNKWQCQIFSDDITMKSCFLFLTPTRSLLQGQAISPKGDKIYHYQWVVVSGGDGGILFPIQQGWIDYCPLHHQECMF
ncbi:DUF2509 family protein [Proteus myxofaciens]|uniref:DUF2509 family protein n=1 Tax=Proteus myxofaciens ATCC 19692 TaxID=1354337 RepID=A0A198GBS0_9GAMM|nr:DUF2509 family protein [Proteus myxofaciens]OAT34355.1 hypothetical protein M983_1135 [Proteus myxofaciens ATCC 19692]